jgi:hypothetical protein
VEAAATGQYVIGAQANNPTIGEKLLYSVYRRSIVRCTVEWDDDCSVSDVKIHVAGRDDLSVPFDCSRRWNGDHLQIGIEQCLGRIGVSLGIGVVGRCFGDSDPIRSDEAGEIVDMSVGVVIEQAIAQPNDASCA